MAHDHSQGHQRAHEFSGQTSRPPSGWSSPRTSEHRRSQSQHASTISSVFSAQSVFSGTPQSTEFPWRTSASIDDEPDSPNSTGSRESIVDDAFFQRYIEADIPSDIPSSSNPSLRFTSHDTPPPNFRPRLESVTIQLSDSETSVGLQDTCPTHLGLSRD
jgi:hypothetical protein